MKIRQVKKEDLAAICNIELLTFPPQEAASYETFLYRHIHFPQYFFLAESGDGAIAAFLSGDVYKRQGQIPLVPIKIFCSSGVSFP